MQVRGVGRVKRIGVIGVAVCGALLAGGISPVWAGEPGPGSPPMVELGSFSVGDGLEGVVNEADGSFGVVLPVAGLSLSWDSRVGVDRYGLGTGWGYGLAVVDVLGGVRVRPSSGGVFEAAESVSSGLLGYAGGDVRFRQTPDGVLEARADGVVGPRGYAFELHELGGVITYFDAAGDPIALVAANGDRNDWTWADGEEHRLTSIVSVDGVSTELDWSDPADVVVRPGANVPADGGGTGQWRVKSVDGRVAEVLDPVGGRSRAGYDRSGRVVLVVSGSGAVTQVVWRSDADGVSRVDRVGVADPDGVELSARSWRQIDGVLPSGWPTIDPASTETVMGGARSAEVSDGNTRVVSSFDGWSRLTGKRVLVTTSAGERVIQEQEFTYPDGEPVGAGDPSLKPVASEVRFQNLVGEVRAAGESYEYDGVGRMIRRASADGTILERGYDSEIPSGRMMPVGRAVLERSTATDGSIRLIETAFDETRTAPVSVEQALQAPNGARAVTDKTEYTVEAGRVVERRAFPGGELGSQPMVTRWDETVDLTRGVREVVETVAPGTDLMTSSSSTVSLLHGGMLEAMDVLGNRVSGVFDELGRPVSVRDAAGRVATTEYRSPETDGVDAVTVTGPDGVAVTEVRDVLGRVVEQHDNLDEDGAPADGVVRVFERHAFPQPGVEETTDAWGAVTRTELDVHGRPVRVTLPNGLVQVSDYDEVAATVTTGSTPTGRLADAAQVVRSRMDDAGRIVATEGTRADGVHVPATSSVYDGFGREVETRNGATTTRVGFDAHGDPVTSSISPADQAGAGEALVAQRRFDASGTSVEKVMSAGGQTRSGGVRELDVLGRTVLETDQAGATTAYEYTPDGLPARVVTSAGQVTSFTYDAATRQVTEARVEAAGREPVVTGYAYDHATGQVTGVFDPADRAGTEITYISDGHGNVRAVRYPAGPDSGKPGAAIAYEYDRHGRKSATIDVVGNRTEFAYAGDGFLTGVVQTDASGRELARVGYTPDVYGRAREITRGNGVSTAYEFTSAAEIRSEITTGPDGTTQSAREYEYDSATGNLVLRIDRTLDESSGDLIVERRDYAYDHLSRLTSSVVRRGAEVDAPVTQTVAYSITVSGQVGSEATTDGASGQVTVREFGYSPTGALEAITTTRPDGVTEVARQEYDPAGNLTLAADGTAYEWDAANRQAAQVMPDGTRIDSTYWADGTRKARTTHAGSTTFHWDGAALINDTHASADEAGSRAAGGVASYLIGTVRHARTSHSDTEETKYYGTDRHGNVTELTDEAGVIAGTYAYSDYGLPDPGPGITGPAAGLPAAVGQLAYNPFQYALEYTHSDGTQFLRERSYAPASMSFTSRDLEPLHDQYGYANSNPIMLVDPSGRYAVKDGLAIFLNGLGLIGSVLFIAMTVGGAMSGGGPGLIALGIGAFVFGAVDATFTGVEIASLVTATRFMSEDTAVAVGTGLALVGIAFALAGGSGKLPVLTGALDAVPGPTKVAPKTSSLLPPPGGTKRPQSQPAKLVSDVMGLRKPAEDVRGPGRMIEDARATESWYRAELKTVGETPVDHLIRVWKDVRKAWSNVPTREAHEAMDTPLAKALSRTERLLGGPKLKKNRIDRLALPDEGHHLSDAERRGVVAAIQHGNDRIDRFTSSLGNLRAHARDLRSPEGVVFAEELEYFGQLARVLLVKY